VDKFIVPNYHVILIHFPLGMLGVGVIIELFSFLWSRSSFRDFGRWLILVGTLLAVPAVTSGLYAFRDVVGHGSDQDSWSEYKSQSNFSQQDWKFIRYHILLESSATGAALIAVVMWLGASDEWRKIVRVPSLLLLLAAIGLMADGAWHGGEMVFRLGFAVQGRQSVIPDSTTPPQSLQDKIEYYVPRGEAHLALAGFVFALAAVSLGLSIHRAVRTDAVVVRRVPPTYVPATAERDSSSRPISLLQALNDPGDEIPVVRHIPAGRFWMLASLLTILTIASGLWFGDFLFHPGTKVIDVQMLRSAMQNIKIAGSARMGMHIVFGGSILVLVLILAALTRFAPRGRVLLSGFSLLLVLCMAAQVWVGVLMLFDEDRGPLSRFKTDGEANPMEPNNMAPMSPSAPATEPSISPIPQPPSSTQPITMAR
jgi:uncharacterized membrane protein